MLYNKQVFLRIQSECRKYGPEKNSVFGYFSHSDRLDSDKDDKS